MGAGAVSRVSRLPISKPAKKSLVRRIRENIWCYIFILPAVIFYLAFTGWPVLASWYYSLFDWRGWAARPSSWGWATLSKLRQTPTFGARWCTRSSS